MPDTIVALSSGAPPAAIAVIRLSGPHAIAAATRLAGALPAPREARVRRLRHQGLLLDRALVLVFPAPDTATGEDLVELHVHGGPAVVDAVVAALVAQPGVRAAEAGEFTRRALMNGRVDLTEVEALGALLSARTEAQRRSVVQAADGILRRNIDTLETRLLAISASIELILDFGDEDDAADDAQVQHEVRHAIDRLIVDVDDWLSQPTVDALHRGFHVVLAGPPNAGKSSLLNRLSGRDMAIVSDIAGTTRDRIEVPVTHKGLPFILTDTAGLAHETEDQVEQIGVSRALAAIADADVLLWLGDDVPPRDDALQIHARADLPDRRLIPLGRIAVSAVDGQGLSALWDAIIDRVGHQLPPEDGRALNDRQRNCLALVRESLAETGGQGDPLIVAHHLASARAHLHRLTGSADTEAMLDSLFGSFCIGK